MAENGLKEERFTLNNNNIQLLKVLKFTYFYVYFVHPLIISELKSVYIKGEINTVSRFYHTHNSFPGYTELTITPLKYKSSYIQLQDQVGKVDPEPQTNSKSYDS